MALAWQPCDLREDPDVPRIVEDPAEVIDAYGELLELLQRPAWHQQAACRGQGWEPWFPKRGESLEPARAICATCPVRERCLADALGRVRWADNGVWGGTSERQRNQLRRVAA